jgi:glycerol-3-phosphate dehydrogenase
LPGGDLPGGDLDRFCASLAERYPWLSPQMVDHYARHYGTRSLMILQDAQSTDDLGRSFGPILHEAEARYLIQQEWARTAQDILMRRTKLHLSMRPEDVHHFEQWMAKQVP